MTSSGRMRSLNYLITTLEQIADTLGEFGLKDEAKSLEAVRQQLEKKVQDQETPKRDAS